PLTGDRKPALIIRTPYNEDIAQISPDGKWIAYRSTATGRSEVYVSPFPSGEGKRQVSLNGGGTPRWRKDGEELYFNYLTKMYATKIEVSGATFSSGTPAELFDYGEMPGNHTGPYLTYDVSADGQKFLIPRGTPSEAGDITTTAITVIVNWAASLKR